MRSMSVSDVRPVSQSSKVWNSSTGFQQAERLNQSLVLQLCETPRAHSSDLSLLPKVSACRSFGARRPSSRNSGTERNESVRAVGNSRANPNGKDSLNSRMRLLLSVTNSPEIVWFADEWHHVSAAADEQVMDRGAEGAAGGCDAV